jgi:hypothetical protein
MQGNKPEDPRTQGEDDETMVLSLPLAEIAIISCLHLLLSSIEATSLW